MSLPAPIQTPHAVPMNPMAKSEARRTLAAATIAIGRATNPEAEFKAREQDIGRAMATLGRDFNPRRFLEGCRGAEPFAPDRKPAQPPKTIELGLPKSARRTFARLCQGSMTGASPAARDVVGSARQGYRFTFDWNGTATEAFALPFEDEWVFAPGPIGEEDAQGALHAFLRHFDFFISPGMHSRGHDDMVIEILRDGVLPSRVLWPHEGDPNEVGEDFPLVFEFTNPEPQGRRYFCGYDPISGKARPYDCE